MAAARRKRFKRAQDTGLIDSAGLYWIVAHANGRE
jgi:hypothetical protein